MLSFSRFQKAGTIRKKSHFIFLGFLFISFPYFACNKSINAGSNKAYIAITNVIEGDKPVYIFYNSDSLTPNAPIFFDSTTGVLGNHYQPVISGIRNFKVISMGTNPIAYLNGNIGLQSGLHYSVFLYDTISNNSAQAVILQDNLIPPPDTMASFRFLNLVPFRDTLYYMMTNAKDTIRLGFSTYIGPEVLPNNLSSFNNHIHVGTYGFGFLIDSVNISTIDSISFFGGKIYTVFTRTKGLFSGTGQDSLFTGMVQHN